MTPVMQEHMHNPPHSYGDCHRAVIASLLDLPLTSVPHFMDGLADGEGDMFQRRQDGFLAAMGFEAVQFPVGSGTLDEVFAAVDAWNPGKLYILGGRSASAAGHSVIAGPQGIVHDPHPKKPGIIGPMPDGHYWITFILRTL